METLLEDCRSNIAKLRERLKYTDENPGESKLKALTHANQLRSLAMADTTAIVIACLLCIVPSDNVELEFQSAEWSREIYELAQIAVQYQPLGAMVMCISLPVAWIGATDFTMRENIKTLYTDYKKHSLGQTVVGDVTAELEGVERKYRLQDL